mgnify:CR=1 FL=1
MSQQKIKTIKIDTGVNPNFLESTLTEDINPLASIFDLIDNSIDAARDHLLQSKHATDEYGLPADYSGYKIHIRIDSDSIRILDNCLGIEEEVLSKKIFLIADTSNHSFGIGHYGVGLKRALLKFGSNYALSTDTGRAAFKARFDRQSFGGSRNKKINADAYSSNKLRKALFCISKLKPEVKYEISSNQWFDNAITEFSTRYAIFVSKGLQITVRSLIHHKFCEVGVMLPKLRTNGNFPPIKKNPMTIEGVQVYIESGIHEKYYFPTEPGYSLTINRSLTKYFGLYFICNDRVIVASSLSPSHGWTAIWHSEYNGFVCVVRFVSENSGKMPWNTAKTEMRTDSTIFLKAKAQLQPSADFYRKDIKRRYPSKKKKPNNDGVKPSTPETNSPKAPNATPTSPGGATNDVNTSKPPAQAIDNQHLHVKNWITLLPQHFPHCDDDVLNAFIIEAITLKSSDAPYAAAMLYRALIEAALKRFVYVTGNVSSVKDHFYLSAEGKKKNHTDAQKDAQGITPPMIFPWLSDNSTLFNDANKARLVMALKKTRQHMPFLNGVVHGNQLTDERTLSDLRNDTVALLEFLVTQDAIARA